MPKDLECADSSAPLAGTRHRHKAAAELPHSKALRAGVVQSNAEGPGVHRFIGAFGLARATDTRRQQSCRTPRRFAR